MKINSTILMQSAKHVAWVFAVAVLIGEFWAIPVWMRVGYAAALLAAWILVYKIEIAISRKFPREIIAKLGSHTRVATASTSANISPVQAERATIPPLDSCSAQIDCAADGVRFAASTRGGSDASCQREDDAIAALVDLGYSRKEAAKISRKPSQAMARIAAEAPARKPHTSWDSFQADKARA